MTSLLQSLIDNSKDRIKSPFVGAYSTSFLIYNWRPITILLFSDKSIEQRIFYIQKEYGNWATFIMPLVFALIYILFLPWINLKLENAISSTNHKRLNKKHELKLFFLEQKKDEVRKEKELEDIRSGLQNVSLLNSEIETLKAEKTKLSNDLIDIRTALNDERLDSNKKIASLNEVIENYQAQLNNAESELRESRISLETANALRHSLSNSELDKFFHVAELIANQISPTKDNIKEFEHFKREGLIYAIGSNNKVRYELSPSSRELYNILLRERFVA